MGGKKDSPRMTTPYPHATFVSVYRNPESPMKHT
jgi:hypothetical protein